MESSRLSTTSTTPSGSSESLNAHAYTPQPPSSPNSKIKAASIVGQGEFEAEAHFYPRVLNAQIHPLVSSFLQLDNERIVARYTHLNPQVNEEKLREILAYSPKYFAWAGCDLFNVTDSQGHKKMIVIETNSCPSGQKSMPLVLDNEEYGGYGLVMQHTFKGILEKTDGSLGGLAVVYDKNIMEASGYAAVMSEVMKEKVYLVEYSVKDTNPPVKWVDRLMYVRDTAGEWHPIRACFRYVTQKPWNRFPLSSKTVVLNSIISCLSGGRNKMMADRAYDFLNAELQSDSSGLAIRVPETIRNVSLNEVPLYINSMGGHGVLKVPYSNAGQGVYTITSEKELQDFMVTEHHYDKFIVQSLVGNASWSSSTKEGKYFHVGTIPNRKNHIYVSDIRMMVAASTTGQGFRPVAIYARKARKPLVKHIGTSADEPTSWEMLGTNLSVKLDTEDSADPRWTTETQRLLLMDRKDFNLLGIGIDDLIDGYVQTVLSVIAIDKMCQKLVLETETVIECSVDEVHAKRTAVVTPMHIGELTGYEIAESIKTEISPDGHTKKMTVKNKKFDFSLFQSLNPDDVLLQEILL